LGKGDPKDWELTENSTTAKIKLNNLDTQSNDVQLKALKNRMKIS